MATNPQGTVPGFNPNWYPNSLPEVVRAKIMNNFEKRRLAAEGFGNTTRKSSRPAAPKKFTNFVKGGKRRNYRSRRRPHRASISRRR